MIALTRLNGARFVLNADLIRTIERSPDTLITLISGEHLIVREEVNEVVRKVIDYGRLIRRSVPTDPENAGDGPSSVVAGVIARGQGRASSDRH